MGYVPDISRVPAICDESARAVFLTNFCVKIKTQRISQVGGKWSERMAAYASLPFLWIDYFSTYGTICSIQHFHSVAIMVENNILFTRILLSEMGFSYSAFSAIISLQLCSNFTVLFINSAVGTTN